MLLLTSLVVTFILQAVPVISQPADSSNLPSTTYYQAKLIEGSDGICPAAEELEAVRNEINQDIQKILTPTLMCGGTDGWSRFLYLDMSNSSEQCPSPLTEATYDGIRVCGRSAPYIRESCTSTILHNQGDGTPYTEVCGRIVGYQYGCTQAFGYYAERYRSNTIDQYYVDGATLTHGPDGSREHIWTFASGIAEAHDEYACPCALSGLGRYNANPPPFVGDDYFCESGNSGVHTSESWGVFRNDPLWDGDGCSVGNSCCSLNNPPYFTKQLPASTTDDIEMRICGRETINSRSEGGGCDTLIGLIELYVK